jgi:hypothetical protein
MASRLDSRAAREKARKGHQGQEPRAAQDQAAQHQATQDQATATWDWPAVAAVVIPSVVLLIVALV